MARRAAAYPRSLGGKLLNALRECRQRSRTLATTTIWRAAREAVSAIVPATPPDAPAPSPSRLTPTRLARAGGIYFTAPLSRTKRYGSPYVATHR